MMVEAGADIPLVQQQSKRECGGRGSGAQAGRGRCAALGGMSMVP